MKPDTLEARDARSVIHGLTNLKRHLELGPTVIERGHGVWVVDNHGREYIEAMSGLWCIALGYGEQRLAAVAARQMEQLAYYPLTSHKSHPSAIELAEKLLAIAPAPMSRVWFANSGSEANDCAVRLAWYYWNAMGKPGKRKLLSHHLAYHGNTIATASLSGVNYTHEGFNLPLPGFLHVACPHYYRGSRSGESETAFAQRLLADIEARIVAEGADTIAAFFTEPIIAAGGVIVPPAGYFDGLQKLLRKYDILLACDEVVTGFARTGNMFGATTMNIVPDMLVCAKALSSAYIPISALMINERVFQAIARQSDELGVFGLTMTYCGHPVATAVAREAIRIYEDEDFPARVRQLEAPFLGGLRKLESHPLVGEVRGRGLLAGVELVRDKTTREPFARPQKIGAICAGIAEKHGLILRAIGDTLALCPPLVISETEIAELLKRLRTALDETAATLSRA
ncbi:MAG: aminotransferase class III-fold pyridoxal phosphate-dependent enzyme [Betaproteobacteria bacterium]|nr:aminotransferase class III-fold pyridoxal phosphate-dependent enzyme [Betaproteobacteria bacterium]